MFDTDHSVVYAGMIPAAPHRAISTFPRNTKHIERVNTTLRPGVSRVVREALSFSKKLVNPLGAMQLFISYDNLTSTAAESERDMGSTILP
jgi:IS1 family transposase